MSIQKPPEKPTREPLPGRLASGARNFVDPPLKVGRIAWGRSILILLLVAALTFVTYTLIKKEVQIPLLSDPYMVDVVVPDAQGLNPAKEPAAGVAGVESGRVVAVRQEGGMARLTVRLDPDLRGKIFRNASVYVRPTSVLQTLIVNILPGDPSAGPLPNGTPIRPENTRPYVAIDDLTGLLDTDTQAQLQVLIDQLATALEGREPELRQILDRLGRLTDVSRPVARALAERRVLLTRLTGELDQLFGTLADRGRQLASAVGAGSRTLEVTSNRSSELAAATEELAPVLTNLEQALAATGDLAVPLNPALDKLVPVANRLGPAAEELRDLNHPLDRLVGTARGLVREGAKPVRQLAGGLKGLGGRIQNDQLPALDDLLEVTDLLYKYRNGLVQFAENLSGLTSLARKAGIFAPSTILNLEIDPATLGLTSSAARSRDGEPSKLSAMLGKALEYTCRDNALACLVRFGTPGLPAKPLLDLSKVKGG